MKKNQQYYNLDTTPKEIDEYDMDNAVNLLVELHELLDRYYNEGGIFNYDDFFYKYRNRFSRLE